MLAKHSGPTAGTFCLTFGGLHCCPACMVVLHFLCHCLRVRLTFKWVAMRYPSRKKCAVMSVPAVLAAYMATASRKHFPAGQAV